MPRFWNGFACLLCVLAAPYAIGAEIDKIDRTIAKEPEYTGQHPLYGLVALGRDARTRIWLVLDKSKPDSERYDVLYADLDGDGDLTDAAERLIGEAEGDSLRFHLPDFTDPATAAVHTGFSVRASSGASPTVMVRLKWQGGFGMGGGYPEDPENGYLKLAESIAAAPILWANGDGPFRFQRWYGKTLTIGGADDFKVFVGQKGVGPNSFWAFNEHFLPEAEGVVATLIYEDEHGEERQAVSRLIDRC